MSLIFLKKRCNCPSLVNVGLSFSFLNFAESLIISKIFRLNISLSRIKSLQSYVVYQFTCAGCKACYVGETKRHLNTRIEEHLGKDKKSHIYSHLQENPQCQEKVNSDCFEIIDRASSYFKLQIKEAMHINWKKPELNKQVKHAGITISI